jgi:M3 family oligoendopeptidase
MENKMKFSEFPYQHLDFEKLKAEYEQILTDLKAASQPERFMEVFHKANELRSHINTNATLASIRHSIDTADEYYDQENTYWDQTGPLLDEYATSFYKICLDYPDKDKLDIPPVFFKKAEVAIKAFDPCIIEELQEENRLISEYGRLIASAKIEFEGKTYNLSSLSPFMQSKDRSVRKAASLKSSGFFKENEEKFDEIYDKLVKVRTAMAKKMGYENYTPLGYLRMERLDYDQEDVKVLRKQILDEVVPACSKIYQQQAERLGIDHLYYYDKNYQFDDGNPTPKGDKDTLVKAALAMYTDMSKETGEFFKMMVKQELFDLETKPNKEMGGYCTELNDYKVPFIFSNFNGTSADVDVLTHEAGHAFQSYMTMKKNTIPELAFPTMESAEIHSMSMEFFADPYYQNFFKEDTAKYRFQHLAGTLTFLPYGCLVDHFQHEVYNNPDMTPSERKKTWRDLERAYLPDTDYGDDTFLDQGNWWFKQGHIFSSPFYYIDYVIAQTCALEFYDRMLRKDPDTWKDYLHLCELGGTDTFLGLIKEAHLKSPFKEGTVKDIVGDMMNKLEELRPQ